jgi:hypothetical protein
MVSSKRYESERGREIIEDFLKKVVLGLGLEERVGKKGLLFIHSSNSYNK